MNGHDLSNSLLKILFALCWVFASVMPLQAQEKQVLVGIVSDNPPYSRIDHEGEPQGLDIDIVRQICKRAKWQCEFAELEWDNLVSSLRSEKIDIIAAGMFATDERKALIGFARPHVKVTVGLATTKTSLLSGFSKADFEGISVGITASTLAADYTSHHFQNAQTSVFDDRNAMYLALANGSIDALADDVPTLQHWLAAGDGQICCRFVASLPYDPKIIGDGISLALRKNDPKLATTDKLLDDMEADGTIAKLRAQHLPFDG